MAYVNFYHSKTEEEALEASVQTGNTGKVYFSNDATTIVKNGVKYGSIAEDIKGLQAKDTSFIFQQVGGGLNTPSGLAQLAAMRGKSVISNEKILNFNAESLKTVGFNQYNPSTSKAHVLQGVVYHIQGPYTSLSLNGATITPDSSGLFTPASTGYLTVSGGGSNTCINLSDPAKNGTYEPYWESNLPLNISTQKGKLNGSGDSIVVFPNGMAGMNGVQDTIIGNVATKKFNQINNLTTLPITLNYEGYAPEEEGGDTVYSFILELPKNGKAFTSAVMNGLFNKKYSASYGISAASSNNFYIYNLQGKSYVEIMDDDFSTDARFDDEEEWDALIADIRASLADKALMYELLSYENYTFDDMAMPLSYKIDKDGTEQIIPNSTDPDNAAPSTVPCDMTVRYKLSYTEESRELLDNVSATQEQDFTNIQKNIARANIGAGTGTVTGVTIGTEPYTPTSGVVTIPAYPTTLPASDVSAWAKAATKPTYTLAEVGVSMSVMAINTNTSSVCGITGAGNSGKTETIIYTNSGSSDLTVTVPTTYATPDGEAIELTCVSGGYCEVNYLNVGGTIYARGL